MERLQRAQQGDVERITRHWGLTQKQSRVIAELAVGKANKEIAAALGCAEVTVEYHLTAIRRKTGLDGRAAMISRFWIDAYGGGRPDVRQNSTRDGQR